MVRRHKIQVQRQAGRSLVETAKQVGVSQSSVQRVVAEPPVTSFDNEAERAKRRIGRPSKAEPFRDMLARALVAQPDVLAVELLRRAKNDGYDGGKSALYELVRELRPERPQPIVRFEGVAGEFAQHDFGEVDGSLRRRRRARSLLLVASEVLALGAGEHRRESARRGVGACARRALRSVGRRSAGLRVRSPEDDRACVVERRRRDRVELDLRRGRA